MLQQLEFVRNRYRGRLVYRVLDGKYCTFSALTRVPSSINNAENYITAICQNERKSPFAFCFYDLQTTRGFSSKKAGEFVYDELRLLESGDSFVVDAWVPTKCPRDIIEAFQPYVGPLISDQQRHSLRAYHCY